MRENVKALNVSKKTHRPLHLVNYRPSLYLVAGYQSPKLQAMYGQGLCCKENDYFNGHNACLSDSRRTLSKQDLPITNLLSVTPKRDSVQSSINMFGI